MLSIHLDLDRPLFRNEDLNQDRAVDGVDRQSCMNVYIELEMDPTIVEKADGMSWCD
jgi:hypothetical protein